MSFRYSGFFTASGFRCSGIGELIHGAEVGAAKHPGSWRTPLFGEPDVPGLPPEPLGEVVIEDGAVSFSGFEPAEEPGAWGPTSDSTAAGMTRAGGPSRARTSGSGSGRTEG